MTKLKKVKALMESMPRMTFAEACRLLGYDEHDPELMEQDEMLDRLKNMFGLNNERV